METCQICRRSLKGWNIYNKNTHAISCAKKNPHIGASDIKKFFSPASSRTSSSTSTPNKSRSSSVESLESNPGSPSQLPLPSRLKFPRLSPSRSPSPNLSSLFINDPEPDESSVGLTLNLSSSPSQTVSTVRDLNLTRKRQLLTDDEMCEGYKPPVSCIHENFQFQLLPSTNIVFENNKLL